MASGDAWSLIAFAAGSTITPGGATMLTAASGAHFGLRRSVPLIAGIAGGLATMAAAAAAGLAGVLLAVPSLQLGMKAAGSAYLIWLAWQVGCSGPPHRRATPARPTGFVGGAWMLLHNPKSWAMTLGAAASFAPLASGPAGLAALLGTTFGVAAAASLSAWCVAGGLLARRLRTDREWRALNAGLGLLLAASVAPMWLRG